MRGRLIAATVGVVLIIGGLALWHFVLRGPTVDDRQQIIRLVADLERAAEQGKPSTFMRGISDDYEDSHGFTRRLVQRLVVQGLRQSGPIDAVVQLGDVTIEGDTARTHLEVDYSQGQPLGVGEDTHISADVVFRRERGGWRVISADGWQGPALQM